MNGEFGKRMTFNGFFHRGEKSQNLARHIALVHSKLDELLADPQLVAARKQEFLVRCFVTKESCCKFSKSALKHGQNFI
jgi:hypothetical protein